MSSSILPTHRLHNWDIRLGDFIHSNSSQTFSYGKWDCFQFLRLGVQSMTGVDLMTGFRSYHSRLGYLRQLYTYCESLSLATFMDKLMDSFGFPEVYPNFAHRGDPVLIHTLAGEGAIGMVSLSGSDVIGLELDGKIGRFPFSAVLGAWRL